jgi:hypothetical protein
MKQKTLFISALAALILIFIAAATFYSSQREQQ